MSYQRDKKSSLKWRKWLQKHHDKLVACGVPPIVLEDTRNWCYFLEHGYFKPVGSAEPIICVDQMNRADAERLCLFLEQDDLYPDCSTLTRLQFILKRGAYAGVSESD